MKLPPRITYRGLTIVLSNPSRFDKVELLSATGGQLFKNDCLKPAGYNLMSCEVRTKEEQSPLLPNTKGLLLLGHDAYSQWTGDTKHSLGEVRGSIYTVRGVPAIPSYFPQDCADVKDYEGQFNEAHDSSIYNEDTGADSNDATAEKRRHGKTSRSNWKFWLSKDTEKLCKIVDDNGRIPPRPYEPTYVIWPELQEVINKLDASKDQEIFLDIETDANLHITCIALGFRPCTIYVVPFVDHTYRVAYQSFAQFLRALAVALGTNTIISHNGAAFDWFVLAEKYKMAIGWDVYDTMLAQHRIFPECEKSLGHCTSLWTHEPFHKDESCFNFHTPEQLNQLLRYCGKDVYTMMLIYDAQRAYAKTIPDLTESIKQVNESVRPYLLMTLQGIHFRDDMRQKIMRENDELMSQYIRMSRLLIGADAMKQLDRKSKKSLMGSNAKCCQYFHDMLGYEIQARSKKTGGPSLAKKALLKLRLKYENPVIDLCMAYREVAKETGSLKFEPWRIANNPLLLNSI